MAPEAVHFILIRGLARESRHWGLFPDELQKAVKLRTGQLAVVDCIDLPGAGRFSEMRCPVSIREITEFVRGKYLELRKRIRERGERPPVRTYLVSISLGGMIASQWLERWPGDFDGAVLMNTSFRGFSPFFKRLSPAAYWYLYSAARNRRDAIVSERKVLELVSNRSDLREQVAAEWAGIHLSRPVSLENFSRQLIAAALFSPSLRKPPVPILILSSEKDRMVHTSCSVSIASAWRTEIRRHPSAGHDLSLDAGSWVAEQVTDWCERLKGKAQVSAES